MSDTISTIFGTGQGSGVLPHFWLVVSDIILESIDDELKGLELKDPTKTIKSRQKISLLMIRKL